MAYNMSMRKSRFFVASKNVGRFLAIMWKKAAYDYVFDAEGNITMIRFTGCQLGDEQKLFQAAAKYIEDGSFLEMYGADGDLWRWVFKNGQCRSVYPQCTWEE